MKRIYTLFVVVLFAIVTCAQHNATYTSQELGISFTYDTDIFYKVAPQAKNTVLKLESSSYMVLVTINVQRNVESVDFSDKSFLLEMANMKKTMPHISKVLQQMKTYRYGKYIGAKDIAVITGKSQYDMVDNSYYFYHRNNLVTITFETFEMNYNEYPEYSENFIVGLKLF